MNTPNPIDIEIPFDPTGFTVITGAQLAQLVAGASPALGIGFIVASIDSAGAPNVPNATVTVKWQTYIWLRVSSNFVTAYVWNPGGATDATFLNWITISSASIGPGTIQGYQIAANTITDANIANVSSTKITGSVVAAWLAQLNIPQTAYATNGLMNSNSRIFGDLNGAGSTVATPIIGPLAVTQPKIALQSIAGNATAGQAQIRDNSITPLQLLSTGAASSIPLLTAGVDPSTNIVVPTKTLLGTPSNTNFNPSVSGVPAASGDILAVTVDASSAITGYTTVRKAINGLPEPVAGNAGELVQVNSVGDGYQFTTANIILQSVLVSSTTVVAHSGVLANSTSTPNYNTTGMTPVFNSGAITKIDTTGQSRLKIRIILDVAVFGQGFVGLYNATGGTVPIAGISLYNNSTVTQTMAVFEFITAANPTNATYYIAMGVVTGGSPHIYVNSIDGVNNPFLISRSSITVDEIL